MTLLRPPCSLSLFRRRLICIIITLNLFWGSNQIRERLWRHRVFSFLFGLIRVCVKFCNSVKVKISNTTKGFKIIFVDDKVRILNQVFWVIQELHDNLCFLHRTNLNFIKYLLFKLSNSIFKLSKLFLLVNTCWWVAWFWALWMEVRRFELFAVNYQIFW